jgi:glycosyltransferase involved in cell wall biosynthesis
MKRLAIITSHPIQYNAPLFQLLTERNNVAVKVFYTWGQTVKGNVYDPDFKKTFSWDIPLLEGYEYEAIENCSKNPSAGSFGGIQNKDLFQHIDKYAPDTLLIYGWSFSSHLKVIRKYSGRVKILFRGDSTLLDEPIGFHFKKLFRRFFLTWVYSNVDIALFTGNSNYAYFLKHGLKAEQLKHAPHAVDNKRFEESSGKYESEAKAWRRKMEIPDNGFVFLFAGKLEPKKDPRLLLAAFNEIKNKEVYLIFVGNGILETELKKEASLLSNVRFLDFQNQQQMPIVYRLGNVFVLPSKGPGETWGLGVNEAMASGVPCIVSDKCGCAEDLGLQANNSVFKAGNAASLNTALIAAFENRKNHHSAHTQEKINQYSLEKIAEAIEGSV